ncbi:hypothetical protein Tco_0133774 [Tanacetum coccineum]
MWILGTNLIFAFPRKFWSSFRVPSYFDYRNTTLLQLLDFSIYDLYWFFHKVEFVIESKLFHWNDKGFANLFKDFERSNVPRVKLSSFSELDDTITSLQALSNLHYLFSGFMDYFWSRKLNISNFGPSNRKILLMATNRVSLDPDTPCQNLGEWNTLIYGTHA